MSSIAKFLSIAVAAAAAAAVAAPAAQAKCTRLGFSVNDYGKDGPTKDAKDLLEKHIAKWASEQGIAKYTVGKKDVNCELFLDFIVFDEHTCRAEATVCWGDGSAPAKPGVPAVKKGEASSMTTGAIAKPAAATPAPAAAKPAQ